MNSVSTKEVERLMKQCQIGFGGYSALNDAHNCLAECYGTLGALVNERDLLLTKVPKTESGKWGMSRLWRAWMSSTAEFMAGNGAIMPLWVNPDGTYTKTRPFNAEDAHELFTMKHMGTDENGKRLSWKKKPENGEAIADKGQRFHALQQHQIWMTERGIKHINPREGEFASLCAMAEGR